MESWAARIKELLDAQGLSQAELARACRIGGGSVSGWFGQGKPTKMISGDNLVAAAAFLGVSPEFIITGRKGGPVPSHSVGLEARKLESALALVEGAIADSRRRVPLRIKATMLARVYEMAELSAETAPAVQAALAGILETIGDD